jgi:hypothetical protein
MPTILTKKKDTAGAPAPGDLTNSAGGAELAVNTFDRRLYTKNAGGSVVEIGTNPSTITATDITDTSLTATRVVYAGVGGNLTDSANLTFNGTTLTAGGLTTTGATSTGTLSASGVATFSAGTVSAPAITTTGDTNTGIYFPAADTMAFTEGGVEAMRINSAGNVGIGTNSPTEKLQVIGQVIASDGGTQGTQLSSFGDIEISKTAGDAYIDFKTSTAEDYDCRISQISNGLRFLTGGNGTSAERVRITSAGRVGVGTTAPSSTLFLSATGTEVPFQFAANTNGASYPATVLGGSLDSNFSGGSGEVGIWNSFTAAATSFVLRQLTGASSASTLMIIKPNGYVGIGGADPSSFITVAGGTLSSTAFTTIPYFNTTFSTGNGVNLQRSAIRASTGSDWQTSGYREQTIVDTTFQSWMQYNGATGGVPCISWGAGSAGTAFGVAEVMRLTSSGLGIGTSSPSNLLDIRGTSTPQIILNNTSASSNDSTDVYLATYGGSTPFWSRLNYNASQHIWRTYNDERMRLDTNGALLIGNTGAAGNKLRVLGTNGAATGNPWEQCQVTIVSDAAMAQGVGPVLNFEGNYITGTNSNANFAWIKAAKTNGTSGSATGDLILGCRGGNIRFSNNTTNQGLSTELMRIDSSGRVTMPNQPAFFAGIGSTSDATFGVGAFLPYNQTVLNTGGFFNTSTNKFTAPVAGRYFFSWNTFYTDSGGFTTDMQTGLNVNGAYISFTSGDAFVNVARPSTSGVICIGCSAVVNLAANDVVGISARSADVRVYQGHCNFSGYLVG